MKTTTVNLLKSVLGAVLLSVAGTSGASTYNLQTIPAGPVLTWGDLGLIQTTAVGVGLFSQNWYFQLALPGALGADVVSVDLTVAPTLNYAIAGLTATLIDLDTATTVASGASSYSGLSLLGGNYEVQVAGNANGTLGGIYAGSVALASTVYVPLPAGIWLLGTALGVLGIRRRVS